MNEEKKYIIDRIDKLLDKRKSEMLQNFPYIHEIGDGVVVRYFNNWGYCSENEQIRFKRVPNEENTNDVTVLHFIPKDTKIKLAKRDYVHSAICLTGRIDFIINNITKQLTSYSKMYFNTDEFEAYALEDTYVITHSKN